jgi:outer membrane protein TolC
VSALSGTTAAKGRPALARRLVLLALVAGCSHHASYSQVDLAQRILPAAADAPVHAAAPAAEGNAAEPPPSSAPTPPGTDTVPGAADEAPCRPLTLADAIALAFQYQPRLRVYQEDIEQARGQENIAFAPFLPAVFADYSAGAYGLNTGGHGLNLPGLPGSTLFLPPTGALPLGLDIRTGYELAELKLQWLLCDFGRRLGRYRQADLGVAIARLQTHRAYQTVANEVAVAYYGVLRTRALRRAAADAVRRAEDDLEVARELAKGGVLEREKVLRAAVLLAQAQRALDAAEGAEPVAVAALNLAIGLNVNAPTRVEDTSDVPLFHLSLADCLQTAVSERREFQVARQSIQVAEEGQRVARASFAPVIHAEGLLVDYQQSSPRGHADLPVGFIRLDWGLFEGGKRVGELRVSDAKVRAAVAQAESVADTIAFQVNEAYRQLVTARLGIERSRPAVEQARENNRLVRARAAQGDATPAEITDAEAALTRTESDLANSTYDYLTAIARLDYAMGATPTPAPLHSGGH